MKTKPLEICINCEHKTSDHNEYGCQHHKKLAAVGVVVAAIATVFTFATIVIATIAAIAAITTTVTFATIVIAAIAAITIAIVFAFVIAIAAGAVNIQCSCTETYTQAHKHKYLCECGKVRNHQKEGKEK